MPTRLGQNFLKDMEVVKKIIASANLSTDDFVIDIGPGEGVLTAALAERAGKVLAIELDDKLIAPLKKRFSADKNIEIIHGDILKINLSGLIKNQKLQTKNYKVIANIPYYITSKIIRQFLEAEIPPKEMILMVQKEVAERIVALPREIPAVGRDAKRILRGRPGQMSILAVSVQYYADAEILFAVGKESFSPVPEVDSAVIRISHIVERGSPDTEEATQFFRTVKAGFSAKRKTLANNLSNGLHMDKSTAEAAIKKIGLKPNVRAQEISIEHWKNLAAITKTKS
jgi:16S rRNA (adenine1518-N6/adenine1519-N6)-dimethyltransferase